MDVYIVFKADEWLSSDSYFLIGVRLSLELAIELCQHHAEKEKLPLRSSELDTLRIDNQLSGSNLRTWGYDIVKCNTDEFDI